MNIGDRIKQRRIELGLSADYVADKLNKNRATIFRYENNYIKNVPTSILQQLARILSTTPSYLMGWEDDEDESNISDTVFDKLKESFDKLNDKGKDEAVKRVDELTLIPAYTQDEEYDFLVAAHIKDDADPIKAEEEKLRLIAKYRPDKK